MEWKAIDQAKKDWLFSCHEDVDVKRGCIGHLRGDFGRSGEEFWTSWFDHQANLKTRHFRDELQIVVNQIREKGCLLHNFSSMTRLCRDGLPVDRGYGFYAESEMYEYCLRCIPSRGDYNLYLYCYDKNAQKND